MQTFRVFVSSPGDVVAERLRVERVLARLNGEFAGRARLIAVRWERAFYAAHATFQAQIPEAADCDVVVAIFRARIGTVLPPEFPARLAGEAYPSGTAYEVLSAIERRQAGTDLPDVYVFRHSDPPLVRLDDAAAAGVREQWERLKAFFERWFRDAQGQFRAAFQPFADADDFERQFDALLREWLARKVAGGEPLVWPIALKGSPYPGLAAFGAHHAPVFFGRERETARGVELLRDRAGAADGLPFLLVVGDSGAGKSSLAQAGLAMRLTTPGVVAGADLWRIAAGRRRGWPLRRARRRAAAPACRRGARRAAAGAAGALRRRFFRARGARRAARPCRRD